MKPAPHYLREAITLVMAAASVASAFGSDPRPEIPAESSVQTGRTEQADSDAGNRRTNSPPPVLVGLSLAVGTGGWIISGVDWNSADPRADETEPSRPEPLAPTGELPERKDVLEFRWSPVEGALGYLVDVDLCSNGDACTDYRFDRVVETSFATSWPSGVDRGRWRVRAIFEGNLAGPWSEFQVFMFPPPEP
ncbi:MAG: hypothetical protein NZ740_02655 [Kiritimatiellae bacterium]|nr:hypothetical protein [Kiritimatiellia bacterium]MDW8457993.1 hypothetical protein [Verrucomicrobiota bacterium]